MLDAIFQVLLAESIDDAIEGSSLDGYRQYDLKQVGYFY